MNPFIRYGQSKLANLLFTRGLDSRYWSKGVIVNSCHPGFVNTNIERGAYEHGKIIKLLSTFLVPILKPFIAAIALITPSKGALSVLYAATSPEIEIESYHGLYFTPYGKLSTLVNPLSLKESLSEKLWGYSEQLVGKAIA